MKEVKCLGCGETYLITENILTEVSNEKLSPEGYCAIVQEKVGFIELSGNGLSE
jgi:hypothetical protein